MLIVQEKSIVKRFKDTIIVNQVNDTNNTPGKKKKIWMVIWKA